MNGANGGATSPTLYHDDCNVCLGIAQVLPIAPHARIDAH